MTLSNDSNSSRISSIDILRGVIIIIMALDHVRDFWSQTAFRPEDLSQTTVILFFTRWITNFCAPVFVFLSGIGASFYARKRSRQEVSIFLITRGLWLVFLEVFVINFLWQLGADFILIEVIWAIGWSMVFLGLLVWLPRWAIAAFAFILIAGHNLIPNVSPVTTSNIVIAALHNTPFFFQFPSLPPFIFSYAIIPWVAVMAAGYLMGDVYTYESPRRNKIIRIIGLNALVGFIVIRFINVYGDLFPWSIQERGGIYTVLAFINTSKYPPSLLFLLMTLGPALIFLSYADSIKGPIGKFFSTYGKVPFFFFLLHIALISTSATIWSMIQFKVKTLMAFTTPDQWPDGYHPFILRAYIVWVILILIMYYPCKWYGEYKERSRKWWLSYL